MVGEGDIRPAGARWFLLGGALMIVAIGFALLVAFRLVSGSALTGSVLVALVFAFVGMAVVRHAAWAH